MLINRRIADWIMRSPGEALVLEADDDPRLSGSWAWGWPALYLQGSGWVVDDYVVKRRLSMHAPDGRKAHILTLSEAAVNVPPHECMIEVPPTVAGDNFAIQRRRFPCALQP